MTRADLSVCIVPRLRGPIRGTYDTAMGALDVMIPLRLVEYRGLSSDQPCPACLTADGTPDVGEYGNCAGGPSGGGSAILMTGNNSIVKDSGNASGVKGGIRSGYIVGVDCVSKVGSQVTGIVVDGVEGTAIRDCSIVDHNVLLGGGEDDEYTTYGIERNGGISTSSDAISDNYVSWFGRGILAGGNKPITIEHNTIVLGFALSPNTGITTVSSTAGTRSATTRS